VNKLAFVFLRSFFTKFDRGLAVLLLDGKGSAYLLNFDSISVLLG
jgi:hypothetical protein